MKEKKSNYSNDEMFIEFTLDECINDWAIKKRYVPEICKKENIEKLDYKKLEEVFSNRVHYMAMKELPLSEKFAIYVCVFKGEYLDRLCKDYQMSKSGFIELKNNGLKHFKRNVKKYNSKKNNKNTNGYKKSKPYSNKKGGGFNG